MRKAVRSQHVWIGLVLLLAFWTTAYLIPADEALLLSNTLMMVTSATVALVYIPTAWRAIRDASNPRIEHIALGIVYAWTFGALWRLWSLLWLTGGQELWMVQNHLVSFWQAGISLGALYHLTSPGAAASTVRGRAVVVAFVVLVAFALAAMLIWARPDTTPFWNAVKPWIVR